MIELAAAVLAGVLLRAGYAPFNAPPAAFVGLIAVYALIGRTRRPLLLCVAFAFTFIGTLCLFVFDALVQYQLSAGMQLAFYAFGVILLPSLFVACSLFAAAVILRRPVIAGTTAPIRAVAFAAAFTAGEWLRTQISPEHGWAHTASVLYRYPQFLGLARYTGAAGITFALAALAALFWEAILSRRRLRRLIAPFAGSFVLIALIFLPLFRQKENPDGQSVAAVLVTPQIAQKSRWRNEHFAADLALYKNLSLSARPARASYRFIVWPETAVMYGLANQATREALKEIAERGRSEVIVGLQHQEEGRTYNAAFILAQNGRVTDRYDKIRLLPYAETGSSPFSLKAEHDGGTYRPGRGKNVVKTESGLRIGMSICFEAAMEDLFRQAARERAQLLVNLSNDSWFGASSESEQQLALLVLRAAETGLPALRATGYGMSAVIDNSGKILAVNSNRSVPVIGGEISVSRNPVPTFFARHGHWFVYSCLIFLAAIGMRILLAELIAARKKARTHS